jgi:hypothetical protein
MGAKPYGSCRRYEIVENPKTGFPQFHSALENSQPIKRGGEFPTAPTGPTTGIPFPAGWESRFTSLRGEYRIEV